MRNGGIVAIHCAYHYAVEFPLGKSPRSVTRKGPLGVPCGANGGSQAANLPVMPFRSVTAQPENMLHVNLPSCKEVRIETPGKEMMQSPIPGVRVNEKSSEEETLTPDD